MLRNLDIPNIPSNGGRILVEVLSIHTGQREVAKTGRLLNWRSRRLSKRSSTIKSTKLRTKVEAHESWWVGSRRENSQRLRPSNTTKVPASLLKIYGTHFTTPSTLHSIAKSMSKSFMKWLKNCLRIGVLFPYMSSYQWLTSVLTLLHLDLIGWHGVIRKPLSRTMHVCPTSSISPMPASTLDTGLDISKYLPRLSYQSRTNHPTTTRRPFVLSFYSTL